MIIHRVKAKNVFCFSTVELDLRKYNLIQVIGNNLDEKKTGENDTDLYTQGNGVGKTSLYHIITEALYSKNINGIKKKFVGNMFTDEQWRIELWVDDFYLVYTASQCVLYKDKEIIVRGRKEVSDFFEEKLPFSLFTSLTYISPKVHIPYFSDTDKYKKEFLQLIFKDLYKYILYHPVIKNGLKEVLSQLTTAKEVLDTHKKYIPQEIPEFLPLEPIDKTNLENIKKELTEIENQVNQIERKKGIIEEKQKQLTLLTKKYKEIKESVGGKLRPNSDLKKVLQNIQNEITKLKTKQDMIKNTVANKVCKLCGSIIDTTQAELELEQVTTELNKLIDQSKSLQEQVKLLDLYNQLDQLQTQIVDLSQSIEEIDTSNLENLLARKTTLKNLLKEEEDKIDKLQKINQSRSVNNALREKLLKEKIKAEQVISTQEELVESLQAKEKRLQILANLFSPNGIFKEKLPERLHILNQVVNKELLFFTNQFQLEFYVENDKVTEKLLKLGKEYPVENCSTGEYTRIVMALLFATKKLLKGLYDIDVNIIFIDEIFGSLDAVGRSLLIEYLKNTDYNVFLISHSYLNYKYPILEITKKNGVSTVSLIGEQYETTN